MQIFNRKLIRERRNKAAKNISGHDFVIDIASGYIAERLTDIQDSYNLVLNLGCHNGNLGNKLLEQNIATKVIFCDSSINMLQQTGGVRVVADEEFLPFAAQSFDLITSSMGLHHVNDLPGCLIQINKCLKPGGVFMAAIPGPETLKELRHCILEAEIEITGGTAPHISPFADVKAFGQLLQRANFTRPVTDSETVTVAYKDIFALMHDLQNMGEGNALIKRASYLRKDVLKLAAEKYNHLYNDGEGGIIATIEIITLTAIA